MTASRLPQHSDAHRPNGPDPSPAHYECKVFLDDELVITTPSFKRIWIPEDVAGCKLIHAEAGVTEVSTGGDIVIQIRNVTQAVDMLSTPITIGEGLTTSYASTPRSAVDFPDNDGVALGDIIEWVISSAGTNAMGLSVVLRFRRIRKITAP